MTLPARRLLLLSLLGATLIAGCETHDRRNYKWKPRPVRVKDPGLVHPPEKTEGETVAPPAPGAPPVPGGEAQPL